MNTPVLSSGEGFRDAIMAGLYTYPSHLHVQLAFVEFVCGRGKEEEEREEFLVGIVVESHMSKFSENLKDLPKDAAEH